MDTDWIDIFISILAALLGGFVGAWFQNLFLQHKTGSGTVYTATHTHQHSLISFFHLIFEKLHGYKCTRFQREKLLF